MCFWYLNSLSAPWSIPCQTWKSWWGAGLTHITLTSANGLTNLPIYKYICMLHHYHTTAKLENSRAGQWKLITSHSFNSTSNSIRVFGRSKIALLWGNFCNFDVCVWFWVDSIGSIPDLTYHDHYQILPSPPRFLVLPFHLHDITKQQKHESRSLT